MANKSLYVGNLSYSLTESDLRALYEPYGPVASARIIGDRGFGFVEVPAEQMEAAITATHGMNVAGRNLTVNEARPREENRDRNSGGYGRRY